MWCRCLTVLTWQRCTSSGGGLVVAAMREGLPIINEEGFRAFWKGNLVTITHRLPYTAVNFYSYERYKTLLKSFTDLNGHSANVGSDIFVHFLGGGLAGITIASATYPLDLVVKNNIQLHLAVLYLAYVLE
ncbi:hypothetical protein POM88_006702 [Heracleum sosnowskyi]|uniref:Uncharacterized protein n=1 Tax=Heracleum sosnowskyi TaxID=360622 RepID=A0AAD8J4R4_9APIA|nr:hypothetical protein POM88_006702 [Heracleum sosnowskyi]